MPAPRMIGMPMRDQCTLRLSHRINVKAARLAIEANGCWIKPGGWIGTGHAAANQQNVIRTLTRGSVTKGHARRNRDWRLDNVQWLARFSLLAGLAACMTLPLAARADEVPLKAAEIEKLLSGNTVSGESDRGDWQQFFDKGGSTTYVRGSEPPSIGAWKIETDKYCSQWPPQGGWNCYTVTGDLGKKPPAITWIGDSGTKYPGHVLEGNHL